MTQKSPEYRFSATQLKSALYEIGGPKLRIGVRNYKCSNFHRAISFPLIDTQLFVGCCREKADDMIGYRRDLRFAS